MKEKQTPSFAYSAVILLALAGFMVLGLQVWKAPLNVVIFLAWILMNLLSLRLGYTYMELEKIALDTVRNSLQAVVIMLSVGALIGVWIASGTVPTIIYYGLQIISPEFYLVTTLLICAIVSSCTGTSWGTMGTVGVALIGIGEGLGVPIGMTAGAIISGSWFGDKLSPLSDTTNFASGVMGVNVMVHVKHMMYNTIPALIGSAIIFLFLGMKIAATETDLSQITLISDGLSANFKISLITIIPMAVVMAMLLMKKAPTQSILWGVIIGMIIAVFYQGFDKSVVFNAFLKGFEGTFEDPFLVKLLNRGGMNSMNSTVQAVVFTAGIGGMVRNIGIIKVLVTRLTAKIKSTFGLVASAMGVSYLSIFLTGSHMFSAIMVQSTMLDLFKSKGLKPENLSRVCEDCGTIGVTLIPYGSTTVFIMSTLGISFAQYVPYAFLCYLCPIISLILAATGFGIARYSKEEMEQMKANGEIETVS